MLEHNEHSRERDILLIEWPLATALPRCPMHPIPFDVLPACSFSLLKNRIPVIKIDHSLIQLSLSSFHPLRSVPGSLHNNSLMRTKD